MNLDEEIIGFRTWAFDGHSLRAPIKMTRWRAGTNKARCKAYPFHLFPPVEGCQCGFQAFYAPQGRAYHGGVFGAILAWGKIHFHYNEFRAQKVRPIVLVDNGLQDLRTYANRHRLILVERGDLLEEASKHGLIIPPNHRLRLDALSR